MVEKISVQIALEGGQAVERQLAGIGEAGQKAFDQLAQSAEKVGGFKNLKTDEVTGKLRELGLEGTKAFDQIQQAVQKAVTWEKVVTGVQAVETAFVNLAKVAGIVGVAGAAAFAAMVRPTIAFAAEIGKAADEAAKLGMSFEQFDRLRATMQEAGVSGKGIESVFQGMKKAADTAELDKVAKAFKELQEAATRGFGAQGTQQLQTLEEAARGTGKAAELARQKLVELGQPIPMDVPQTLAQLRSELGSDEAALRAFLEQLAQMPNVTQRNKFAMDQLGVSADTLARILERMRSGQPLTGLISAEDVSKASELNAAIERLSAAWGRFNSLTIAPALTQGIDTATIAVQGLTTALGGLQQIGQSGIGQQIGSTLQNAFTGLDTIIANVIGRIMQGMGASEQSITAVKNALLGTAQAAQQAGQAGQQAGEQGAQGFRSWEKVLEDISKKFPNWNPSMGTGAGPGFAGGGLIGGRGSGTSDSNLAWLSRGEFVITAAAVRRYGAGLFAALNAGRLPGYADGGSVDGRQRTFGDLAGSVFWQQRDAIDAAAKEIMDSVFSAVQQMDRIAESLNNLARDLFNSMKNPIAQLDQVSKYLTQLGNVGVGGGLARGGLLGGRGSGTSDSNLAWVSRGEHIMPARAVAQPGVLAFLEALRRSGGNLRGVLDGMGRFALGGLVPRAVPAFAGGGPVGGMSNVTIQFPGVQPIAGLRASSAVVDELRKAAALAQVRSGGRKPSRYS